LTYIPPLRFRIVDASNDENQVKNDIIKILSAKWI